MKIIDITMEIKPDMVVYKDKPEKKPKIEQTRTIEQGACESKITLDSHCGTHIDAPKHMITGGRGVETFEISKLVGPARVLDMTHCGEAISAHELDIHAPQAGEFILLKTHKNEETKFNPEFKYIDATGARSLVKAKIAGVGIDTLGIERLQPEHETHIELLKAGIPIIEGLKLDHVKPGKYRVMIMPLKIPGIDAAPCRAILIDE